MANDLEKKAIDKSKNKKMISLEISEDLKEALRIEAFRTQTNTSSLIRTILELTLAETLAEVRASKQVKEEE